MPVALKAALDTTASEADAALEAGASDFFVVRPFGPTASTQALPTRSVRQLSFSEQGAVDAMVLLLEGTGFALSVDSGSRGLERLGATSLFNLSGSLSDVLARMAERAGLFHQVRDNTVVLTSEAPFVIELPPLLADDSLATITASLQHLGARDVHHDLLNRTLAFTTNPRSLAGIRDYLGGLRERRSLLVYDVHVFQVDLPENRAQGIAWNGFIGASTAALNQARGSVAAGAVFSGEPFSLDALQTFLQSQGSVQAVSRPRIVLVSGGRGQLRVGQSTTFVSKVGNGGPGSVAGARQVMVETQTLNTGFELTLNGDVQDGVVYTRVALNLSDILKFQQFTAQGTRLNLPQTSSREVMTTVQARSGDLILLGGILLNRDSGEQAQGLAAWLRPATLRRSELVLALKPRVLPFARAQGRADGQVALSPAGAAGAPVLIKTAGQAPATTPATTPAWVPPGAATPMPQPAARPADAARPVSTSTDSHSKPGMRGWLTDIVTRVSGQIIDATTRPSPPASQP